MSKLLNRATSGKTLYILVKPTIWDFAIIQRLLDVLNRFVEAGNSEIVIENIMDGIKYEEWIIDMGPNDYEMVGYIVSEGTPDEMTTITGSYTGKYLLENLTDEKNH